MKMGIGMRDHSTGCEIEFDSTRKDVGCVALHSLLSGLSSLRPVIKTKALPAMALLRGKTTALAKFVKENHERKEVNKGMAAQRSRGSK